MKQSDLISRSGTTHGPQALSLLVVRCQLGEPDALDQLVVDWHPALFRYVASFVAEPRDAGDICQSAWVGVLRGLPALKERGAFAPWFFGIARRSAFEWMRQRYRRAPETAWPEDDEPEDAGAASDESLAVETAALEAGLQSLAPLEREVVLLHYFEELTIDDITGLIGAPAGTIKSRLHRARRKLRAQLRGPSHE